VAWATVCQLQSGSSIGGCLTQIEWQGSSGDYSLVSVVVHLMIAVVAIQQEVLVG